MKIQERSIAVLLILFFLAALGISSAGANSAIIKR
jgi:hypothetical protein